MTDSTSSGEILQIWTQITSDKYTARHDGQLGKICRRNPLFLFPSSFEHTKLNSPYFYRRVEVNNRDCLTTSQLLSNIQNNSFKETIAIQDIACFYAIFIVSPDQLRPTDFESFPHYTYSVLSSDSDAECIVSICSHVTVVAFNVLPNTKLSFQITDYPDVADRLLGLFPGDKNELNKTNTESKENAQYHWEVKSEDAVVSRKSAQEDQQISSFGGQVCKIFRWIKDKGYRLMGKEASKREFFKTENRSSLADILHVEGKSIQVNEILCSKCKKPLQTCYKEVRYNFATQYRMSCLMCAAFQ